MILAQGARGPGFNSQNSPLLADFFSCLLVIYFVSSAHMRCLASEARSAIVQLVRILGPHPSDPGSSPGGGILLSVVPDLQAF